MIKRISLIVFSLMLLFAVGAAAAQDVIVMEYGDTLEGEIEDREQGILYAFEGVEGDEIVITAVSDDIDVYMRFGDEDGILAENDNISRSDTNAEITYTLEDTQYFYFAVLGYEEGEYEVTLTVTSQNTSDRREVSDEIPALEYGDSVEGEVMDDEEPVIYTFAGTEGDVVIITAESRDIEPYIVVVDVEGELVAEDYEEVEFEVPADGDYLVGIFGEEGAEFELAIDADASGSASSGEDAPDTLVFEGSVSNEEPFSQFVLEGIAEGTVITIDVQAISGDLDAYVGILFNDEVVAENDDRESGDTNPLLEYRAEEDGDYVVIVTRYGFEDGDTEGDYEAVVEFGAASKAKVLNAAFGIAPTGVRFLSEVKPVAFDWTALNVTRSEEEVVPNNLWNAVGGE